MKHFYLSAFILLSFASTLRSQELNLGPRATALGNTGVALQEVWSIQSNQAGITSLKRPVASMSYKNNFLNPELSTQSAVIVAPVKENVLGLSLQNYGFSAYSEQRIGFCYARSFGNSFSASLNFNIHQVRIQQYGSAKAFSLDAGMQFKPSGRLVIATHICNPYASSYQDGVDAVIPMSIEVGSTYKFSDKLLINSGIVKTINALTDCRLGLEYALAECFFIRGGVALQTVQEFAGFGYRYQKLMIDAATSVDPHLGYSPQLALSYEF